MAEECTRHFVSPWVIAVASLCATVMVGVCMYLWYRSCVEVKQQHMLELYTLCCQLCAWKLFVLVQNRNLLKPSIQILLEGVCLSRQFYMRVSSLCLFMSVHCVTALLDVYGIRHHIGALLVVPDSLTRHKFSSLSCLMIYT